jgi:hypothetical protein
MNRFTAVDAAVAVLAISAGRSEREGRGESLGARDYAAIETEESR